MIKIFSMLGVRPGIAERMLDAEAFSIRPLDRRLAECLAVNGDVFELLTLGKDKFKNWSHPPQKQHERTEGDWSQLHLYY